MKRILSVLLTLIVVTATVCMTGISASEETYSGSTATRAQAAVMIQKFDELMQKNK